MKVVPVVNQGDDLIAYLNKAMHFLIAVASSRFPSTNNQLRTFSNPRNQATIQYGRVTVQQVQGRQVQCYAGKCHMARQCTQPKRPRNAAWFKEKAMLAEAQEAGQILDEEQLAFLADPGIPDGQAAQTTIPNTAAFQTEDLDAYDSDCDDVSNAKAVLMANLSNYGSDVILEVPHFEPYHTDMDNQSVHAMQGFEQTPVVDFIDNEITSDSNIIPYSQYLQETQQAAVQDTNLYAQQDSMILSVIEQMSEQMINHKAQRIKPTLYDGSVISSQHVASPVIDDEETLILEEYHKLDVEVEYPKLVANVLCYPRDSKLTLNTTTGKLVAVTSINKDKRVRFVKPVTSSNNIPKQTNSLKTKDSNKPLLTSTGVKPTTSASGSKPLVNTKNNRITRPPSSNQKNKVEDHSRKVKSSLNKKNSVNESISNALVKHSVRNAKFESMCAICNKCLFDANHDMCLIDFVNDVNVRSKAKSKRNKMRKAWKPMSKVFTDVGYKHNLFSVGQFYDADLEVAFRKNTCFIPNLEGVDLLSGSRDTNLYIISLDDMLKTSLICLLSKASNTKSWLWHRLLSHLNFGTLNKLAKDRSCTRSKDEAPDAIIKCIKNIQVRLNATVRNVRTDNGTEFNDVVKRQNRTLVEAAHTMLIFLKVPLFLWAEAINTACYTQNCSLVRLRYNKNPYELMHDKKPDLSFFHVFGSLCYPTNDSEDLGKFNAKADIGIFVGYAPTKKAFRIYNRRTRKIMETIHVTFDELTAMASEQFGSGPGLQVMTPATSSSGLVPNIIPQQPCNPLKRDDWDSLFQPLFAEYFNPPTIIVSLVPVAAAPRAVDIADSPVSMSIDQDSPSSSIPSTQDQEHSLIISQGVKESPKTPLFHDDPLHEPLHEESTS
ncbi:retrovirus-related pol polyprotein from transposon TNT 1-94 [Tanacetum coccineum]|uniref:Retrovirus-related pol polyprotein from transposon TNT 1-94 n=1 Tax=Tanacetum coccineum TaxID=301880 RepID=A0ABQ4Y1B6_9ASTR